MRMTPPRSRIVCWLMIGYIVGMAAGLTLSLASRETREPVTCDQAHPAVAGQACPPGLDLLITPGGFACGCLETYEDPLSDPGLQLN